MSKKAKSNPVMHLSLRTDYIRTLWTMERLDYLEVKTMQAGERICDRENRIASNNKFKKRWLTIHMREYNKFLIIRTL